MKEREKRTHPLLLPGLMMGGATLGLLIGGVFGEGWKDPDFVAVRGFFKLLGDVLINVLKALVVPLVIFSVMHAMAGIGDVRRAGRLFLVTIIYFCVTMMLAISLGLVLVNVVQPGVGASTELRSDEDIARVEAAEQQKQKAPSERLYDVARGLFPSNLFKAAGESDVLGLLLFSIALGLILATMGERGARLGDAIGTLNDAMITLVRLAIWFAPIGIMGLVAERIGSLGGMSNVRTELVRLGWYAFTVVLGLIIHAALVLPAILYLIGRQNPLRYVKGVLEALVCAFTTASSAATLPLTIRCLEENNGISDQAVGFIVPLGATANMNGTALYEAVAAMFIAQAYGIELGLVDQFLVLITAMLAAIGAAAIPEAGLVTMVIVLVAVDLPVEGIGLILAIDWILDRCRTAVNVWDDCVGAAVVERWMAIWPVKPVRA